ncbi:hypothetical protein DPMN_005007 [Dreissena polymorpha]|uniref:Uncharacterized protein n=1 Tax=Dreissena polymorpha TaxID=45954 RepID=A0A9D4RW57_DREPO|nr:hypothetical protein DPMN_005007 [Dreissena polymorpha]
MLFQHGYYENLISGYSFIESASQLLISNYSGQLNLSDALHEIFASNAWKTINKIEAAHGILSLKPQSVIASGLTRIISGTIRHVNLRAATKLTTSSEDGRKRWGGGCGSVQDGRDGQDFDPRRSWNVRECPLAPGGQHIGF